MAINSHVDSGARRILASLPRVALMITSVKSHFDDSSLSLAFFCASKPTMMELFSLSGTYGKCGQLLGVRCSALLDNPVPSQGCCCLPTGILISLLPTRFEVGRYQEISTIILAFLVPSLGTRSGRPYRQDGRACRDENGPF